MWLFVLCKKTHFHHWLGQQTFLFLAVSKLPRHININISLINVRDCLEKVTLKRTLILAPELRIYWNCTTDCHKITNTIYFSLPDTIICIHIFIFIKFISFLFSKANLLLCRLCPGGFSYHMTLLCFPLPPCCLVWTSKLLRPTNGPILEVKKYYDFTIIHNEKKLEWNLVFLFPHMPNLAFFTSVLTASLTIYQVITTMSVIITLTKLIWLTTSWRPGSYPTH